MNRYSLWSNLSLIVIVVMAILFALPNLFGEVPALQIVPTKNASINLVVLKQVEDTLKQNKIAYQKLTFTPNNLKLKFFNTNDQIKAKDLLKQSIGKDYIVAFNLVSESPCWLTAIGAKPMYLGLDLRGGVHFLLQIDTHSALNQAYNRYLSDFRSTLRKERISYAGVQINKDKIEVQMNDQKTLESALTFLEEKYPNFAWSAQGLHLIATFRDIEKSRIQSLALEQNLQTLRNRINELGVTEPIIQQQGLDRIVVQLPGVQDTAKAKDILGRTASLEIRLVDEDKNDAITLQQAKHGNIPLGDELFYERDGQMVLVKKKIELTGKSIKDASPGMDTQTGFPVVYVTFDGFGASIFKQVTKENVGKRMAILLVEKNTTEIITAPVINEEIGGGNVQISGMKNTKEATDIALLLRAGALATPMEIIEERTVGPSMGEENIQRGRLATLWGFVAISVFMIFYYLVFGVTSVIALSVNLLLLVALLSILQATLTLPGVAAIALTLGMAIDANVLINERIREELRNKNSPQNAILTGYQRAFGTILDSNVTTLIAGLALFMFGTGPVKGFAVVHVLGILTSMFSAVIVSRSIINVIYGGKKNVKLLVS